MLFILSLLRAFIGFVPILLRSITAWKYTFTFVMMYLIPVILSYTFTKVSSMAVSHSLDYTNENYDMSDYQGVTMDFVGLGAWLFVKFGIAEAVALVLGACSVRLALSLILKIK